MSVGDIMRAHAGRAPAAVIALALLLPTTLAAQDARPEDVATIDGILRAYYEVISGPAGEASDVERDRSLHHPDAWVAIASTDEEGRPRVRVMSLDEYHGANAPRAEPFWEWETDREVRRSGNMAHVWSSYASARTQGGEPFDRGVNSITLFHDGTRWWIMGWMFDAAAEGPEAVEASAPSSSATSATTRVGSRPGRRWRSGRDRGAPGVGG